MQTEPQTEKITQTCCRPRGYRALKLVFEKADLKETALILKLKKSKIFLPFHLLNWKKITLSETII